VSTDNTAQLSALIEGVPDALRDPLTRWVEEQFAHNAVEGEPYSRALLEVVGAVFGQSLATSDTRAAFDSVITVANRDPGFFLDVVDLVLNPLAYYSSAPAADADAAAELEQILRDASSVWTASTAVPSGLERRSDASMLAREVIESSTRAGDELRGAWRYAWGRRPNASEAYRGALRAVEYGLGPVVARDGSLPTMADLIAKLRADLAQFEVRPGADDTIPDAQTVLSSLELLQQGMNAGLSAGYPYDPLTVTRAQAQAATAVVARLIHLAQSANFTRR